MPQNNELGKRPHALLGASSASRWLNCPPSARWDASFPEKESSEAAQEGTLAHAIAEEHLRRLLAGKKPQTPAEMKRHPLYRPVMEDHIAVHTGYVMELLNEERQRTPDARLLLEERVDYCEWVPEGFGTADVVLLADNTLHVIDFKYGKGVPVGAAGNPQLRLYALGAWRAWSDLYDLRRAVMHIVQPRLESITSDALDVPGLLEWAENYVLPRARLAWTGGGEHTPGEHCRWCRAKHLCRAYAQQQMEMARLAFDPDGSERDPRELSPAEISEILSRVDELSRWATSVKKWALEQATAGEMEFPGYKVVEGRSNRVILDQAEAIRRLKEAGVKNAFTVKLAGITEIEELLGKAEMERLLDGLIVKPTGKPTLVRDTDKRPALIRADDVEALFAPMEG